MQDAAQASGQELALEQEQEPEPEPEPELELEQELEPAGAEEPGRVATFQPS